MGPASDVAVSPLNFLVQDLQVGHKVRFKASRASENQAWKLIEVHDDEEGDEGRANDGSWLRLYSIAQLLVEWLRAIACGASYSTLTVLTLGASTNHGEVLPFPITVVQLCSVD